MSEVVWQKECSMRAGKCQVRAVRYSQDRIVFEAWTAKSQTNDDIWHILAPGIVPQEFVEDAVKMILEMRVAGRLV